MKIFKQLLKYLSEEFNKLTNHQHIMILIVITLVQGTYDLSHGKPVYGYIILGISAVAVVIFYLGKRREESSKTKTES